MHPLDQHCQRAGAASDIKHAKSAFELRLFDQPPLGFIYAEQLEERIVERKEPAFSHRRKITSLGMFHRLLTSAVSACPSIAPGLASRLPHRVSVPRASHALSAARKRSR